MWVIFALLDPDPLTRLNPDPQPWSVSTQNWRYSQVVMLAMDELVDNGMILEADPAVLVSRVALRTDDIPLGEQTVAQVPVSI